MTNKDPFLAKTQKLSFGNLSSLITLDIEYLSKKDIFKIEDGYKKIEKDNTLNKHPRFLSEDNTNIKVNMSTFEIINIEDAFIPDNYYRK